MTISIVQKPQSSNSGTSNTITQTLTVTAGSTIVVFTACDSSSGETISGCSDNINGSYGAALNSVNDATSNDQVASFAFVNTIGGTITVTVSFTGTPGSRGIWVIEVAGAKTSGAIDGHTGQNQVSPGTGTDATTSGNASNSNQPALVIGLSYDTTGGNVAAAAGTGFTDDGAGWNFSGATNIAQLEDKRVTATGNHAATFTTATGTDRFLNFVVIVDEASSPITWIQGNTAQQGTTTSLTCTYLNAVNATDLLVAAIRAGVGAGPITVSDNVNGAWTQDVTNSSSAYIWHFAGTQAATANTLVVTVTATAQSATIRMVIDEFSKAGGILLGSSFVTTAATTALACSATNSVGAGNLVYAGFLTAGTSETFTAGASNGVTCTAGEQITDATLGSAFSEYVLSSAFGTQAPTCTATGSNATSALCVVFAPLALLITVQPATQFICSGHSVTFSVTAITSGGALSYQWMKNGSNVGTNSSSYSFTTNYATDNLASIVVVVTDNNGSVTSNTAILVSLVCPGLAWMS